MRRLIVTFALVLALPLALSAQQGEQQRMQHQQQGMHQGQGMQHGMMGGMMGGMGMMMARPGPGMILRLQETLELSDEQVAELEAMHEAAHAEMQEHQQAAQAARTRAHEAMMAESADLDAFQSGLEEAAQHQVQAMVAMARVHTQAGEVLTESQTQKLHTLMKAMQEIHHQDRGMMGEGMHGEGMQGRMQEHQGMRSGG